MKRQSVLMAYIIALCALIGASYQQRIAHEGNKDAILDSTKIIAHYELPQIIDTRSQQIIEHLGYTVSYNNDWLIPNWVAYELTQQETYDEFPREKKFSPDPRYGNKVWKNSYWQVVKGDRATEFYKKHKDDGSSWEDRYKKERFPYPESDEYIGY